MADIVLTEPEERPADAWAALGVDGAGASASGAAPGLAGGVVRGQVTLREVAFRYADIEPEVLSGVSCRIEPGAVFLTKNEDGSETVWFTTLHDPERRRVAFVRVIPAFALIEMAIDVAPRAEGGSRLRFAYRLTGLSDAGNAHIRGARPTDFAPLRERTAWLARSLDHFLATGTMLRRPL